MKIRNFFTDEDAVSPVIGVILMVAITVILAAVIGTFVLGLGQNMQQTSPQASMSFDYTENPSGHDSLTIAHDGGDTIDAARLTLSQTGATDGADSDGAQMNTPKTWSNHGGPDPAKAGSSLVLDETDFSEVDNDAGATAFNQLDLSSATVKVIWTSDSGDNSATVGEWEGPDA